MGRCIEQQHNFNSRPHEEVDRMWLVSYTSASIFQLTTSRRGRLWFTVYWFNVLRFQLTTSRRGRRRGARDPGRSQEISTHDLTKRSTLLQALLQIYHSHFNSRPHEEVDGSSHMLQSFLSHFNSRPHEEVDFLFTVAVLFQYYFNSRPHEEVDIKLCSSTTSW